MKWWILVIAGPLFGGACLLVAVLAQGRLFRVLSFIVGSLLMLSVVPIVKRYAERPEAFDYVSAAGDTFFVVAVAIFSVGAIGRKSIPPW